MGWCKVGSSGEECDEVTCRELGGGYIPPGGDPVDSCLVLRAVGNPIAQRVIRAMIYPPILEVRDRIMPGSPVGDKIGEDFQRHYEEGVRILGDDKALLQDLVEFMILVVPFSRALTLANGESNSSLSSGTPSVAEYTSSEFRPSIADMMVQLLERFRTVASPEFQDSIVRYQRLIPELVGLTPNEFRSALDNRQLLNIVGGSSEPSA
jgi:hypothetical protein